MKASFLVIMMTFCFPLFSHEDHSHGPVGPVAPNGGQLKVGKEINVEVLGNKTEVKIYPYDHDMKALTLEQIEIKGNFVIPRKQISKKMDFKKANGFWHASIDGSKTHRYVLDLTFSVAGKNDQFSFQVEPK
jgi:hypothetical protein